MMSGFEIFENVVEIHAEENEVEATSKEEKMVEYVRSLKALEDAMEPYKEQKQCNSCPIRLLLCRLEQI